MGATLLAFLHIGLKVLCIRFKPLNPPLQSAKVSKKTLENSDGIKL